MHLLAAIGMLTESSEHMSAGLDTCLSIMRVLHSGTGDSKYRPCPLLVQHVDAGVSPYTSLVRLCWTEQWSAVSQHLHA